MSRRLIVAAMALLAAGAACAEPPASGPASAPSADDLRVTPVVLAYRRARPAVVSISAERVVVTSTWGLPGGDPFEDIFPSPLTRQVPVQSLGSGVILHPAGYVVTNAHVVRRAEKITVTVGDKDRLRATVLSADDEHDLAVLKVELPAGKELPFLPLGRSDDLMVGETVIAIGNPMGYASSLSTGVISALDRALEFGGGVRYSGLIQTDAPINPGNSGGPLLNVKGELIGVNSAIRADAQNIGFAIPADLLATEFPRLLDFERIRRVVLGAAVAQRHGRSGDELHVTAVGAGTPADGVLKLGDRLIELDGKPVRQITDFCCGMMQLPPAGKVRLKGLRDGKEFSAEVELKARPRPDGGAMARRLFGLTLRAVTPEMAKDMRLSVDSGLVVTAVEEGGPAQALGLQRGDVLFQVGRYIVRDLDELGMLLEDVQPGQTVQVGIVRRRTRAWAPMRARSQPAATTQKRETI